MKALIRQRPWLIIVAVKVLFVAWWISFVVWASHHTPENIDVPTARSHAAH
ncbi:MAG: hypothetical protein DVB22_001324 [Verrucomicrobia bacterium]|jgi:hypothetical protein|nr:MAG: hypothetical protein DVB22_001324 [Verrucomicrobiota bacterium]